MRKLGILALVGAVLAGLFSWLLPRIDRPPTPQEIGHKLLAAGRLDDAILLLESHFWRGVAEYRAGRFDRALGKFFPAETVTEAYNIGTTFARLEDWNGAMAAYRSALRLDPNHADSQHNLAIVFALSKLTGDATVEAPQNTLLELSDNRKKSPPGPNEGDDPKKGGSSANHDGQGESAQRDVDQPANSDKPGKLSKNERIDQAGRANTIGDPDEQTEPGSCQSPGAASLQARESTQAVEMLLSTITDRPETVLRRRLHTAHQNRQPAAAQ
jgi:tetratricopeptide (TPR) repeat protein